MNKGRMSIALVVLLIILVLLFFGFLGIFGAYKGVWNRLNIMNQKVEGGKSAYSASLNVCTQKIKGVWTIANQYIKHESKTFENVAKARAGYFQATEQFEALAKNPNTPIKELTTVGAKTIQSALAFQVQIEAYPQLMAVETSKEAIAGLQEGVNEIKTALDDWITTIKDYNTYRGSFGVTIVAGFMGEKYPAKIAYYEGEIKALDIDSLNPDKESKTTPASVPEK